MAVGSTFLLCSLLLQFLALSLNSTWLFNSSTVPDNIYLQQDLISSSISQLNCDFTVSYRVRHFGFAFPHVKGRRL